MQCYFPHACYNNIKFSHFCSCVHFFWAGGLNFKESVGCGCDWGDGSCSELAGCLPGGGECAYMCVSVHLQLGGGCNLGLWELLVVVGKCLQEACTLGFFCKCTVFERRRKNRREKSHRQRRVWLHTFLPRCVGGTATEHSLFLTCVTPN